MTWEQFELILKDYGPIVLTFALALIFISIVYKSWPLISNFVIVVNALVQLPKLIETVGDIKKEVLPNGGGSMRDVVNATAAEVTVLKERFDEHLGKRPSQVEQLTTPRKTRTRKPAGGDTHKT